MGITTIKLEKGDLKVRAIKAPKGLDNHPQKRPVIFLLEGCLKRVFHKQ